MRVYRLVLRAFPRRFREAYGEELEALAAELVAREPHRPVRRAGLLLALFWDAVVQGLRQRRLGRRRPRAANGRKGLVMDRLRQDLAQTWRALAARPGFSLAVIALVALGIGANTAIFSVVNATILRPLPYADPGRLVWLWERYEPIHLDTIPWSMEDYIAVRDHTSQLSGTAVFRGQRFVLTGHGEPVRLRAGRVEPSLFTMLGVSAMRGRVFRDDEGRAGHEHVALLSFTLWQSRFGGAADIVGQSILLNDTSYDVVGVLPPEASFPPPVTFSGQMLSAEQELFVPLVVDAPAQGGQHGHFAIGRLASGASPASAGAELAAIASAVAREHPDTNEGMEMILAPLHGQSVMTIRSVLFILLGAVGAVLLIACASVANLLFARGTSRTREMALRAALGAGRGRLVRQLLFEALGLGLAGGLTGLVVAQFAGRALAAVNPIALPPMFSARLDARVFLFTLGVTIAAVLVFGLLPALQVSRVDLVPALKAGGRGGPRPIASRTKSALVVLQIALALVLLTAAGLMIGSLARLWRVDPGFQPDHVAAMPVELSPTRYAGEVAERQFQDRLLAAVRALPGVSHASLVTMLPFTFDKNASDYGIDGQPPQPSGQEFIASYQFVSTDYFTTLGIPLATGRAFGDADGPNGPPVVVVNESLVRRHWPGNTEAIGRRLVVGTGEQGQRTATIVGVVPDVRMDGFDAPFEPMIYQPLAQRPSPAYWLAVQSSRDAPALAADLRGVLHALDAALPPGRLQTMGELMGETVKKPRFATVLLSAFGIAALLIAAAGLYGVLAFDVMQRLRDFALRLALGATPRDVRRLVLGRSFRLVGAGLGLGLVGSIEASRLLSGLLFGANARDAVAFVVAGVALTSVAGLAAWLPARRATTVDPIVALRAE